MSTQLRDVSAERLAYGIKDAALNVGVSPSFIRKEIEAGHLRPTRLGRRVLIKHADLIEWVNRNDDPSQSEAA